MFPYLPPYPAAEGVSVRIAFILRAAMVYVGTRVRQVVHGMGETIIPAWVEKRINGWIEARRTAIVALVRRIEAGTQKPPRPYQPREAKPDAAGPVGPRKAPALRMPTSFAWLCTVGREVRVPGQQLATLLNEDMREMVIAHPQLARLIRPVLRMTGEQVPVWFPKPTRRARAKRPVRPARPAAQSAAHDPSGALVRYIDTQRAEQYAASVKMLYGGCGGPPPEVAKTLARLARKAAPPPTPPVPVPVPVQAAAAVVAPSAEAPVDRDKYYYAETWDGRLIPVRRRWGW
jgi:hypothetical protein